MTPELERLKQTIALPTLPSVAAELIRLAADPDLETQPVIETISHDPVLSAKIISVANSAWYGMRTKSATLSQAFRVIGINAALTLVLSFSLLKTVKGANVAGLDHQLIWRRSLLSALAARGLGGILGKALLLEEMFLAALIQDIGMMALSKADPKLYAQGKQLQQDHRKLIEHERQRFGHDHAEVGAWLLSSWNLPKRIVEAVRASHQQEESPAGTDPLGTVVRLSGPIADLFLWPNDVKQGHAVARCAEQARFSGGVLDRVFDLVVSALPETQQLFEMELLDKRSDELVAQARELLAQRQTSFLSTVPGAAA